MKMHFRLLLALLFISTVLLGCGNNPAPPPPAPEAPPAAAPEPKKLVSVQEALAAKAAAAAPPAAKVTLYRDTWGVPHIYGDSFADAAYAMGYAQAEDRLDDLYLNIRTSIGTLSEIAGKDALGQDLRMHLVANADRCKAYWETQAPPEVRAMGDSFMRGVQAFLKEHPDKTSPYALELQGWQCLAVGRTMIFNWPLDVIQDKVNNKKDAPAFSSNSFAVAPGRSADGSAILMTDPHLTWEGMAVFYEGRMHAPGTDICGYWLVGSPLPVLGHSGNVAWACTTGGPDTSDAFMVKLNPDNPLQYQYNGEWKDFGTRTYTINVRGGDPVTKTALDSIYGPVWEDPDPATGIAYCGASRYIESMGLMEQSLKMVQAKSCDEFQQALSMFDFMEQNISFADTDGHIAYLRNGSVPIRPEGTKWTAPIPGGTDATRWLGFHDIKDLVQIKDPEQGYFQNCNCSPANMMRDSIMTPDKYRDYIYNVSWDKQSPRGARLLELLDADTSVTKEEAMAYTLDVHDLLAKPWQLALQAAIDTVTGTAKEKPAVEKKKSGAKGKKPAKAKAKTTKAVTTDAGEEAVARKAATFTTRVTTAETKATKAGKSKSTAKAKTATKAKSTKKKDYMANPDFAKAAADILAWNGDFTRDSVAAPVVRFWRLKCESLIDTVAIAEGKPLGREDQVKMLDALEETLAEMKTRYGTLDLKWGDITLVGRGGKFFPCDGADFGSREKKNYTQTPMVTGTGDKPNDEGKFITRKGSSTIMLSFLNKEGIDSYSLVVWGQSADPNSPHHVDQSEKLYSERKFKPTWFKKEDLLKNVESEKTLTVE
jgi:acyl-homoserine lactone acylase PvdQ